MATITDEVIIKIKIANEKARTALVAMKKEFKNLGADIAKFAKLAAVALAGLVTALGAMVLSTANVGDEIAKMSKKLNISTEDLSALRFQAGLAGTDFKAAATGIRFMTKAMFDATQGLETAKRGFEILGLSVTDTDGKLKDAQDIFLEISDALAAMEDGTEKTAAAQLLFGSRMGTQLIPLLNQGSDALREQAEEARELGIIFDKEAAAKSEILVDSMLRFKKSIEGIKNAIAFELIPEVSKHLTLLKAWVLANKELISQNVHLTIRLIADALATIRNSAVAIVEFVRENNKLIKTLAAMTVGFASVTLAVSVLHGNIPGAIASLAALKKAIGILTLSLGVDKLEDFAKGIKGIDEQSTKARKGMISWDEAIKRLNENFKKVSTEGVKAAETVAKKWAETSDKVKAAFEALGIVPKIQFEDQVKGTVKTFETLAKESDLSNDDIVEARADMFEKLQTLADQAKEEGVLGVDLEEFKANLSNLQEELISKTRGTTRTLRDSTGRDVTDLKNASVIILEGFTKDSVTLAAEVATGINSLFEDTTIAQQSAFQAMEDEVNRLADIQFKTERNVTENLKGETEERLNIIKDFVFDAQAEYERLRTFQMGQRGAITPTASESDLPFFVEDGLAKGSPFIPKTGLYQLHQGEAVIPAAQNNITDARQNNDNRQISIYMDGQNARGRISVEQEFAIERSLKNISRFDASLSR